MALTEQLENCPEPFDWRRTGHGIELYFEEARQET
jgi:hypothetical protein